MVDPTVFGSGLEGAQVMDLDFGPRNEFDIISYRDNYTLSKYIYINCWQHIETKEKKKKGQLSQSI